MMDMHLGQLRNKNLRYDHKTRKVFERIDAMAIGTYKYERGEDGYVKKFIPMFPHCYMESNTESNELSAFHISDAMCQFYNPSPKKDADAYENLPTALQVEMAFDQKFMRNESSKGSKESKIRKLHLDIKL